MKDKKLYNDYLSYMQEITDEFVNSHGFKNESFDMFYIPPKSIEWLKLNTISFDEYMEIIKSGETPKMREINQNKKVTEPKNDFWTWEIIMNK
jgi:hypothetical protein